LTNIIEEFEQEKCKIGFWKKWLVMSDTTRCYQAGLTDILNIKKQWRKITIR